jgi:Protein kinase domain
MVPRIGTEFAGYRIVALLGRGGMSVVYRAENPRLGMAVALKVLAPELADDEAFRERFVSESRLAAALNHPNIITIYDAGEADGSLYIAMRHVSGDLRQTLAAAEGPLAPERLVAILRQVAGALDAAHAEGLIHRDVKPANILLEGGHGRPEVAYLADFGLTKRAGSYSGHTMAGEFLGTIDYMAPEQIEQRQIDGRADLYSLGCVAYQCLTGSAPFPRATDAAVLWAHMQEPAPAVTSLRPELPAGFDGVLARALAKSPDDRYSSCEELVDALEERLEGPSAPRQTRSFPVPPAPPQPPDQPEQPAAEPVAAGTRQPRPRRRVAAAVALALLAGAAAGGAAILFGYERDPEERVVTERQTVTAQPSGPTPFERDLLRLVPAAFRDTCEPIEPSADVFDSTVRCRPGSPVVRAEYSHVRSGQLLRDHWRDRVGSAGVALGIDDALVNTGACGEVEPSMNEWRARGRTGHEETDSVLLELGGMTRPEVQRTVLGHVLCHRERGRAWVEWTNQRAGVYALATGPNRQTLSDWWKTAAGPLTPP